MTKDRKDPAVETARLATQGETAGVTSLSRPPKAPTQSKPQTTSKK